MDFVTSDIHGAVLKCWNILVFVISQVLRIWDPWTWVRRSDWCDASTSAHKCHLQQQEVWKQETKKHSKTNQTDSKDSRWQDHFDKVIRFYVYVRPKSPWALPLHPNCIGNLGVVPLKDESLVELNACENWKSWHCHFIHQYQSMRIYDFTILPGPSLFSSHIQAWVTNAQPFSSNIVFFFLMSFNSWSNRDFPSFLLVPQTLCTDSSLDRQAAAESSARRSCASGAPRRHGVRRADGEGADDGRIEASRRGRVALARMVVSLNHTKP